mgnify:CR=1 FL=1
MVDCYSQKLSNRLCGASDRATLSEITKWVTVGAFFICLILVYAWSHNEIFNIRYQMEELKKESRALQEINAVLRAEYSSLVNPESVEHKAIELGLVASNRDEIRILDSTQREYQVPESMVAQVTLQKKTLHE